MTDEQERLIIAIIQQCHDNILTQAAKAINTGPYNRQIFLTNLDMDICLKIDKQPLLENMDFKYSKCESEFRISKYFTYSSDTNHNRDTIQTNMKVCFISNKQNTTDTICVSTHVDVLAMTSLDNILW